MSVCICFLFGRLHTARLKRKGTRHCKHTEVNNDTRGCVQVLPENSTRMVTYIHHTGKGAFFNLFGLGVPTVVLPVYERCLVKIVCTLIVVFVYKFTMLI
jgi:hypothetical protein